MSSPSTRQANVVPEDCASRLERAHAALDVIARHLRPLPALLLTQEEREQVISALAYARSQRRPGNSDATQQHRDWLEAETDLDLILMHLRSLQHLNF